MIQRTTPEPSITLPDPTRPPRPAPDCDVCASLDTQRIQYEEAGNIRRSTDCEVEIRNHPHPKKRRGGRS
ncbi:hypothetical protein [Streptomyces sp. NBC_00878]|uniref:hypothetical protein n=1 Tax=Streptomyces sp. NBC_00878 TaxID=2975854 RepID=UPI002259BAE2|nr:hypothetical protein [Streptomyces sp. NBC_00878]MCX4908475.1 hypothetical protein [Streptomyces sp. NBC_00878]